MIVYLLAKLGNDVSLHINTSIVAQGHRKGTPIIGNGVVIGDVYIADNIAIGANSVVTKSFEDENIAIAGAPAKKISDNGSIVWGESNKKF